MLPPEQAQEDTTRQSSRLKMSGVDVQFKNPISHDASGTAMTRSADISQRTAMENSEEEAVVPESLDFLDNEVAKKENERDRRRRVALQRLSESKVIDPDGKFRRKWDFVQMMLLTYVAFGVPYRLGFSHPVVLWSAWFWFDACVDLYFVVDVFVSLSTAFWDDSGELIVEPGDIRRNYFKSWFAIDLSSCFPGNYISCAILPTIE